MIVTADPSLVRACLLAPLDAAPRLALSDWLEGRGWGDRLLLAALRGKGEWQVDRRWRVVWAFEARAVLGGLYGEDVFSPGELGGNVCHLRFGLLADGPGCHDCGPGVTDAGLRYRGGAWRCDLHLHRLGHFIATGPLAEFATADGYQPAIGESVGLVIDEGGEYRVGLTSNPDTAVGVVYAVRNSGNVVVRLGSHYPVGLGSDVGGLSSESPTYPSVELWRGLDATERYGIAVPENEVRTLLGLPEPKGD